MELKKGYTTGSCAAIASKAAARMLFENTFVKKESIITPNGIKIEADIKKCEINKENAVCAVEKYSGDDPDVTNGIMIYSKVTLKDEKDISIDGGIGIGRVTKKGLWLKVGDAAINKVPREMIKNAVLEIFDEYGYEKGAEIIISAPDGEEIAKKTFNKRLGIEGGISILGTSGIVEPMSSSALIETIKAEMSVKRANGSEYTMIAPGNYGIDFIKKEFNVNLDNAVKCSNFVGEAVDFAAEKKFKGIVLIGHIGKFVKIAGGIMNTHSKNADCRMEIIAANAALVCDNISVLRKIMLCTTTEEAVEILKNNNICDEVMKIIIQKAVFHIRNKGGEEMKTEIIIFSDKYGILGESSGAREIIKKAK